MEPACMLAYVMPEDISYTWNHDVSFDDAFIAFVDRLLNDALHSGASDIHIEPHSKGARIRFRIDGKLQPINDITSTLLQRLCVRIKILAKLDISEKRLPQDGQFQFLTTDNTIDIRVSTYPILHGEKIVMRVFNLRHLTLDIYELGLLPLQTQWVEQALVQTQGLILITGPTGCGKTITLYSALTSLNKACKNINTLEDPIEMELHGINQTQVHSKIQLHFAELLRAMLRQDPDVIMLGEIRDTETATIAIQAAQTGHLVLSTFHTNSALECISRLHSMDIAYYPLIQALSLVISQRLLRKLCKHCKQKDPHSSTIAKELDLNPDYIFYKAIGCQHCCNGYKGRTGIFEVLPFNTTIKHHVLESAQKSMLDIHAFFPHFISLRQAAIEKLKQGISSWAEINEVTNHVS